MPSEEALLRAQNIACRIFSETTSTKSRSTTSDRTALKQLLADAHMVYAALALERGATKIALGHAKKSLRLNRFAWTMTTSSRETTPESGGVENLTDELSNLSVSTTIPQKPSTSRQPLGASLWTCVNPLVRSLSYLSNLYAHHGMFRETMYYAVQAHQLVTMTNSTAYIARTLVARGSTWLHAGTLDQASELLMEAKSIAVTSGEKYDSVLVNYNIGKLHGLLGSQEAEQASYDDAHAALEKLIDSVYIGNLDRIVDPAALLEEEMSRLAIKQKKKPTSVKATAAKRAQTKKMAPVVKPQAEAPILVTDECIQLASLQGLLLRRKAHAFMMWKKCDDALAALREADNFTRSQLDIVDQHLGLGKQVLLQAMERMTADPVYSTLLDSTISLPSAVTANKGAILSSERTSGTRLSPPKKATSARERTRAKSPSFVGFYDLLRQAQDHLLQAHASAIQVSSTTLIHNLSSLLNGVMVLLASAGPSSAKSQIHPSLAACSLGKFGNRCI
jgi:separase